MELDKLRHFRCDLNALALIQEKAGLNLLEEKPGKKTYNAVEFRAICWALLVHEDPSLTIEHVGAMLTPLNMGMAAAAFAKAVGVKKTENPKATSGG